MKRILDICHLPLGYRQWLTSRTWCDSCYRADLGITEATIYEEAGKKFVQGKCKACGTPCNMEMGYSDIFGGSVISM